MKTINTDIAILGGGASGLMCGVRAGIKYAKSNKKAKITILERQNRVGKKLLITGNGRCNLTNINACKDNYYGSFSQYIEYLLNNYSPEKVLSFFEEIGLKTTVEQDGRVYPLCKQSSAVLDVLRFELERLGIDEICEFDIMSLSRDKNKFKIISKELTVIADNLVFATGSKAYPKAGGDASGLDLLKNLGHHIVTPSPALCAVVVNSNVIKSLKGIRAQGKVALIKAKSSNYEVISEETGEIQFTDTSLSGICVFNLAHLIDNDSDYYIAVSLLPDYSDEEIKELLSKRIKLFANSTIDNLFTGLFHKRIGQALLKSCEITDFSKKVKCLGNEEIQRISNTINNWKFKAKRPVDFSNAQVMSGGIKGNEINPKTMESNLVKNLYICGEVIDIHGDCGGFNLQYAFSSAMAAGDNL